MNGKMKLTNNVIGEYYLSLGKKTIEEKNRMIAEFMDIKVPLTHGDDIENSAVENGDELFYIHELEYHTSWDWLIPVASRLYLESRNLDGMNAFRMSHIIQNYQTAVVNNEIAVANHYVLDGINLLNEQKP